MVVLQKYYHRNSLLSFFFFKCQKKYQRTTTENLSEQTLNQAVHMVHATSQFGTKDQKKKADQLKESYLVYLAMQSCKFIVYLFYNKLTRVQDPLQKIINEDMQGNKERTNKTETLARQAAITTINSSLNKYNKERYSRNKVLTNNGTQEPDNLAPRHWSGKSKFHNEGGRTIIH